MEYLIDSKIHQQDKMYGAVTVGSRGQVVIPAKARQDLKIKPGDQLLVMGKFGKVLGLIKAEQLSELVNYIMENINDKQFKLKAKTHLEKIFGDIHPLKKGRK